MKVLFAYGKEDAEDCEVLGSYIFPDDFPIEAFDEECAMRIPGSNDIVVFNSPEYSSILDNEYSKSLLNIFGKPVTVEEASSMDLVEVARFSAECRPTLKIEWNGDVKGLPQVLKDQNVPEDMWPYFTKHLILKSGDLSSAYKYSWRKVTLNKVTIVLEDASHLYDLYEIVREIDFSSVRHIDVQMCSRKRIKKSHRDLLLNHALDEMDRIYSIRYNKKIQPRAMHEIRDKYSQEFDEDTDDELEQDEERTDFACLVKNRGEGESTKVVNLVIEEGKVQRYSIPASFDTDVFISSFGGCVELKFPSDTSYYLCKSFLQVSEREYEIETDDEDLVKYIGVKLTDENINKPDIIRLCKLMIVLDDTDIDYEDTMWEPKDLLEELTLDR